VPTMRKGSGRDLIELAGAHRFTYHEARTMFRREANYT
jgi:hypothetical protein